MIKPNYIKYGSPTSDMSQNLFIHQDGSLMMKYGINGKVAYNLILSRECLIL